MPNLQRYEEVWRGRKNETVLSYASMHRCTLFTSLYFYENLFFYVLEVKGEILELLSKYLFYPRPSPV